MRGARIQAGHQDEPPHREDCDQPSAATATAAPAHEYVEEKIMESHTGTTRGLATTIRSTDKDGDGADERARQFTLFASELAEARELGAMIESAGYEPRVVVCAKDRDTPYLCSAFVKVSGHSNIRRFLAPGGPRTD